MTGQTHRAAVLALATVIALACGGSGSGAGAGTPTPAQVPGLVTPGTLTLATTGNFPPFTLTNPTSGKVQGFSIDVAQELANRLGLKLATPTVDFVAELQGLASGRYDLADSGVRPTAERQKQFLFSIPMASGGMVAGVAAKNKDQFKAGISDVKGVRVGAVAGSIPEQYFLANKDKLGYASYTGFPGAAEALTALETGRIDLFLNDPSQTLFYVKQNPGRVAVVGPTIGLTPYAMVIRQSRADFQAAINPVLEKIVSDGTLAKLQKRWFGVCLPTPVDINQTPPYPSPKGCG